MEKDTGKWRKILENGERYWNRSSVIFKYENIFKKQQPISPYYYIFVSILIVVVFPILNHPIYLVSIIKNTLQ